MTPSEEIARFLTHGPIAEDVTIALTPGCEDYPDLFPERLATRCARCGEGQCWRLACRPEGPVRTFSGIIYHCATCQGEAGFYLMLRWTSSERDTLVLRKVAQYLPPGRAPGPAS